VAGRHVDDDGQDDRAPADHREHHAESTHGRILRPVAAAHQEVGRNPDRRPAGPRLVGSTVLPRSPHA
jgi:hypothetical protein